MQKIQLKNKHLDVIALALKDNASCITLEGTVRSSKTVVAIQMFYLHVKFSKENLHCISAKDYNAIRDNLLDCNGLGLCSGNFKDVKMKKDRIGGYYLSVDGYDGKEKRILLSGYSNKETWKNILGKTIDTFLIDEANTANKTFIDETFSRQLSVDKPLTIFTLNGSDATGIHTTSVKDGDDYIINGTKCFITAGNIAKYHIVVAIADIKNGEKGFNGFIVDADSPGVSVGKIENKMGLRGLPTTEVIFEDVRVPASRMLGGKAGCGKMMKFALGTLDAARIGTGAQALGVATAAFEKALAYSSERKQFGKPINANQGIAWELAEMATKLDISRLLIYRAAWMEQQGLPFSKEASMAKLIAPKLGREVVNSALQIHGGYGYMHDYPLERYYRDIKITEIYEGASEIQKIVIANNLIPRAPKKKKEEKK